MTQARPAYDRVQGQPVRCWRCEQPLRAYTDGNGLTLWSCDRCVTEIRQLRERLRLAESGKVVVRADVLVGSKCLDCGQAVQRRRRRGRYPTRCDHCRVERRRKQMRDYMRGYLERQKVPA